MLKDQEELSTVPSKSKEDVYTLSNYEDSRNVPNKPISHTPSDYIQKARVTKAVPPKPAYDPMQFVQLRPCNLVKSAQEQIKKAENVKKTQEEKKEEPEEWQCNLDNWKSSRRKRVEHIIDRVVEVKKFELEEHDRNRRKSKTFNEMMEQRGSRRLKHLPIYTDDDNNDLTEYGLSACDSTQNEAPSEVDKEELLNNNPPTCPTDTTEYTYEGAIEGYKSRISRASGHLNANPDFVSVEKSYVTSTDDKSAPSGEISKCNEQQTSRVSRIDFLKRKELFEKEHCGNNDGSEIKRHSTDIINTILDDALEMAFQEIDTMEVASSLVAFPLEPETNRQNMSSSETNIEQINPELSAEDFEPYYQVPKSQEPYYEVPKTKFIPLYENVDLLRAATIRNSGAVDLTLVANQQQPPKEKPPPPPVEKKIDEQVEHEVGLVSQDNFKRINSTKRIKNEIRNSRSSFLGIESQIGNEEPVTPSSKSIAIDQQDSRQERNILQKSFEVGDNRGAAVPKNHSHQNSDFYSSLNDGSKDTNTTNQLEEQPLFALNTYKESFQQSQDSPQRSFNEETHHWLIDNEFLKHENFNNMSNYVEAPLEMDQVKERNPIPPPIPPAKPLRSQQQYNLEHRKCLHNTSNLECGQMPSSTMSFSENQIIYNNIVNNNNTLTPACRPLFEQPRFCKSSQAINTAGEMSVTASTIKPPSEKAQLCGTYNSNEFGSDSYPLHKNMLRQRSHTECSPQWSNQHRKPSTSNSRHWLIQEAEQRRIEQQTNIYHSNSGYAQNATRKSLPDSVIQSITQRVQSLGIGTERRWSFENQNNMTRLNASEPTINPTAQCNSRNENDDKILSVSGKKKCSHCNNELGRGAAMVIESLGLLYHIHCFKCCVCHTRLGDGFKGTDVRVRKYKLHCQNCFSSEDGVKFSCV